MNMTAVSWLNNMIALKTYKPKVLAKQNTDVNLIKLVYL